METRALHPSLGGRHVRQVAERPGGRQREADLGGPGVATTELVGATDRDDLASPHHGDAVGQVLRLVHVMRRQEDRLAELAQRPDRGPRLPAGGRIEAGRRLIEEDQVRVADEREREVEPPALAAGQGLRTSVSLLLKLDEPDHLIDTSTAGVVAAVHLDQFGDGQLALDAALLKHDPDPLVHCAFASCRVHGEHGGVAAVALAVALENLDGGRLARAVRAEQAEHLSLRYLETDPAHPSTPPCALRRSRTAMAVPALCVSVVVMGPRVRSPTRFDKWRAAEIDHDTRHRPPPLACKLRVLSPKTHRYSFECEQKPPQLRTGSWF